MGQRWLCAPQSASTKLGVHHGDTAVRGHCPLSHLHIADSGFVLTHSSPGIVLTTTQFKPSGQVGESVLSSPPVVCLNQELETRPLLLAVLISYVSRDPRRVALLRTNTIDCLFALVCGSTQT